MKTTAWQVNYAHVYFTNGFAVSAKIAGKEYKPPATHACLRTGHWCWSNLWQHPDHIIPYVYGKVFHLLWEYDWKTEKYSFRLK